MINKSKYITNFRVINIIIILIFLVALYLSYENNTVPIDIDEELRKISTKEYFEEKISLFSNNSNKIEAEEFKKLADYLDIKLDPEIQNLIEDKEENFWSIDNLTNKSKNVINGFVYGETKNEEQFYASIASDLTVVGDVRDFYNEGSKLANNEDYDELVLGLSTVGLALSVSQVATLGATTAVKVGASTIKVTAKAGKLSKEFIEFLSKKISKTVNFDAIKKNVNFNSIDDAKKSFIHLENSIDLSHMKKLGNNLSTLQNNTSFYDTTKMLKYIDNEKDLHKLVEVSSKYKKNTKTVMRILGKGILKATKTITKFSAWFIAQLFFMLMSIISLIGSFIFSNLVSKIVTDTFKKV